MSTRRLAYEWVSSRKPKAGRDGGLGDGKRKVPTVGAHLDENSKKINYNLVTESGSVVARGWGWEGLDWCGQGQGNFVE